MSYGGMPATSQASYPSLGDLLRMKQMAMQRSQGSGGPPDATPVGPAAGASAPMPGSGMSPPTVGSPVGPAPAMPSGGFGAGPPQAAGAGPLPMGAPSPQPGPNQGGSNPLALAAMLKQMPGAQ